MPFDRPRLQVLIGDRDVSARCDTLTFSATDNGGYEIATLGLPSSDRPKKGTAITIRQGLEVAWFGRVAEIADHSQHGRATKTTGCEGWRALMRDSPFAMIYVDRDLTRWGQPSTQRQINELIASARYGSFSAVPDTASGAPSLAVSLPGSYNGVPLVECWYDAGPLCLIGALYYQQSAQAMPAGWNMDVFACADDVASVADNLATLTTSPHSAYVALTSARRYLDLLANAPNTANATNASYLANWKNLAVYGNHGLTRRGADPGGFYPSDIARHALSQCKGILAGQIVDSTGYIAPHVVYRTSTAADVIVDDMAKLMGWSWGVWEPPTALSSSPRLDFRPPPPDATAVVSKAECDQLDITSRLGDLYNVAQVSYTDPVKGLGVATVTLANPQLTEAGIAQRTLLLDMGAGSLGAATTFGLFALALSQIAARAAGQATLPVSVRLPGGGHKPACLLRPGIDRLRIIDLVDGGALLDIGTVRRDVFRISRVETTVAKDGSMATRVELDNGTNLLEVLQARLSTNVGFGASGR